MRPNPSDLTSLVAGRKNDPYWFAGLGYLPNPDVVLRKLGRREEVFTELLADSHVLCEAGKRKAAVTSRELVVRAGGDRRADRKAAELVRAVFDALDMTQVVVGLLDAPLWGRAYAEVTWRRDGGQWLPVAIGDRPQRRFVYGEGDAELRVLTKAAPLAGDVVPPYRMLQCRSLASHENPYGVAALSACYWPWLFKHNGWKWWAIFAERYGMPWIVGKLPRGATVDEERKLDEALERAIADAALRVPEGASLELLQASGSQSSDVYGSFVAAANAEISKALLGQTLTAEVGKVGSYAAAEVHNDVRGDLADADAQAVAATLRELASWVTQFNVATAATPRVELVADRVPGVWIRAIGDARKAGIPVPLSWALERTGIPDANGAVVLGAQDAARNESAEAAEFAESDDLARPEDADEAAARELGNTALEQARAATSSWKRRTAQWFRAGRHDAAALYRALDSAPFEDVLLRARVTARVNGLVLSGREGSEDFVDPPPGVTWTPLPPEAAIRAARRRVAMSRDDWQQLDTEERWAAFTVSRLTKLDLIRGVQETIALALESGQSTAELERTIQAQLGEDALPAFTLETIVRNAIQTAHNTGRWQEQTRPEALRMRPYWRYDAIDDSRTRPAHRALDGKVLRADDPFWNEWYPPNGHRCRCRITSLSERDVQRKGVVVEDGAALNGAELRVEGVPVRILPDPGFGNNPAKSLYQPDLSRYPEALTRPFVQETLGRLGAERGPVAGRLKQAGIEDRHLIDLALQAPWASAPQELNDRTALQLSESEFEGLVRETIEQPDAILVWFHESARRRQVAFYREDASSAERFAVVWDPQAGIEGAHADYRRIKADDSQRRGVEEL
jgi:SPP1 gp7 family putative phage head morphogenesis protein